MFKVSIWIDSQTPLYDGQAKSVILPGKDGTFEVLTHHKPVISLLKEGAIIIDKKIMPFLVKRGVVTMSRNELYAMIETH